MHLPTDTQDALKNYSKDPEALRYIVRVLRDSGWTLGSIAQPLGVTREWVRQLVNSVEDPDFAVVIMDTLGFSVPLPPEPEEYVERKEFVRPTPLPDNVARLRELQPFAKQVRSNSPKYRAEAEEYTALIAHEHIERGVSLFRLAKELGVTHAALRFRLVRYGYKEATSEHKVYKPIAEANRALTS